jgi:hypothetical protein
MIDKKILVVSHERAGTHFLVNSIALNFGFNANQIDLARSEGFDPCQPDQARIWLARYQGRCVSNIFKSHHDTTLLLPTLTPYLDEFQVFYIYRDGRDVLTSFWRYLNRLKSGWGPQVPTPGDFIRAAPTGGLLQYQANSCENMLARWIRHVSDWLDADIAVHFVSYELLHQQFEATLSDIGQVLQKQPSGYIRPGIDSPASLPWRGEIGSWRTCWTGDDEVMFEDHAGALMLRLGYGIAT